MHSGCLLNVKERHRSELIFKYILCFEPCWRLLRVPWTARRSNQSNLKEISPEYSLEGLMLKPNSNPLATWCKELTQKRPYCWERLKAGGEGDDRGWAGWMASLTQWTWIWASSESWWRTGRPGMLQSLGSQRVGHDWGPELPGWFVLNTNTGNQTRYKSSLGNVF